MKNAKNMTFTAMAVPNIKTASTVVPMIYAYTTPGVTYHDGWTKIGYTEQNVEVRIRQQTHTADIRWKFWGQSSKTLGFLVIFRFDRATRRLRRHLSR